MIQDFFLFLQEKEEERNKDFLSRSSKKNETFLLSFQLLPNKYLFIIFIFIVNGIFKEIKNK